MFSVSATITDETKKVAAAADRSTFRNLGHAAASIRKTAIAEIEKAPGPSDPGAPPHTRKGLLRRAIVYSVDGDTAVIGPRESIVGTSAEAMEFGGEYKGGTYPERPFMGPALDTNIDRFAKEWSGSVVES